MSRRAALDGSKLPAVRADRLIFWRIKIPLVAALLASTAASFSPLYGSLAISVGVLVICVWLITVVIEAGIAMWRQMWKRAFSHLAILVLSGPAMGVSLIAGDYLHLVLVMPYYLAVISASGANSDPISFHWPSVGLAPSYELSLVYDASDELANHVGKVEPVLLEPAVKTTVRHLAYHFYLREMFW